LLHVEWDKAFNDQVMFNDQVGVRNPCIWFAPAEMHNARHQHTCIAIACRGVGAAGWFSVGLGRLHLIVDTTSNIHTCALFGNKYIKNNSFRCRFHKCLSNNPAALQTWPLAIAQKTLVLCGIHCSQALLPQLQTMMTSAVVGRLCQMLLYGQWLLEQQQEHKQRTHALATCSFSPCPAEAKIMLINQALATS
jgi:hypothetical protein